MRTIRSSIYYAGHGVLNNVTKKGYWIPVNARIKDRSSHISNSIIQDYIEAIPARHVLLVADSCFSGSLFGTGRSFPPINDKFFSSVYRDKSRWGMTSGNLTPVADSGSGGHSIFACHFLKMLRENENPYMTPMQIYDRIGPIVTNNSEQRPVAKPIRNTGDEGGLFVFIRTASLTPSNIPAPKPSPAIPAPPAAVILQGHLQINVNAPNSQISINGVKMGTASPGRPLNLRNLPTGSMNVRANAKGFDFLQRTVSIERNKWTQEVIELRQTRVASLPPASTAYVKVGKYKERMVRNGGSIEGTVMFNGRVPDPIMEDLSKGKNTAFCATHPDTQGGRFRPRVKVSAMDGKLKDVVVFIENIESGKPWGDSGKMTFEFEKCDIKQKIGVIRKTSKAEKRTGDLVKIINQDTDILHNPHGYSVKGASRKTLFNKPLPRKGDVADVTKSLARLKQKKDKHFFLQCDQHKFMEADARIVWNPYYSISTREGSFTLDNVPAGTYRVTAWHPYAGEMTLRITVEEGASTYANFEL
jgi:hypothetical protein